MSHCGCLPPLVCIHNTALPPFRKGKKRSLLWVRSAQAGHERRCAPPLFNGLFCQGIQALLFQTFSAVHVRKRRKKPGCFFCSLLWQIRWLDKKKSLLRVHISIAVRDETNSGGGGGDEGKRNKPKKLPGVFFTYACMAGLPASACIWGPRSRKTCA